MSDYNTRILVFGAAAKVAAANPDCITGFSVTHDPRGFRVAFESYDGTTLYRSSVYISETELVCMSKPELLIEHMLRQRVELHRRQLHGKEEENQASSKEGLQEHLCTRVCRPCTTPLAGPENLRRIPQTDISGVD